MKIKEMFLKDIDRQINGVIKVGQNTESDKKQELEEYVVTNELRKHFSNFFDAYAESIHVPTDKIGVWISGFFGSGKSHFLKILSYILGNEEIDGKKAVDYFLDKDLDTTTIANMRLSSQTPTKAILFNVDSKSSSSAKLDSNAIVNTFNRAFNERLGYYGSNPYLADLERDLDSDGKYDAFKKAYKEITGLEWKDDRRRFMVRRGKVVDALVQIGYMNQQEAELWAKESTTSSYKLASDDLAQRVEDYIEKTGNRVVFLIDEIGQFIATDPNLMLNLQTITEDLGTHCKGKAWVIVTAQEDIDSMVKSIHSNANDFSKIQGRFNTRLSLSSVNADEVIRKRILAKTPDAAEKLRAIYDTEQTTIQNVVDFRDTVEMKKYKNADDFSSVYPFLPYQFNLLADVLNAIRTHSTTGKSFSEGERSMLAAFQDAAQAIENEETGALVPFYLFYNAIEQELDHTNSIVIQRAMNNSVINPKQEKNNFNVNVLKALFLLKYVAKVPMTVGNIVSLMVSNINDDRVELKQKVEDALKVLIREAVVSKLQDTYVFLTDEEQDINREIRNRDVPDGDVIRDLGDLVTTYIYTDTRFRVQRFNGKYTFAYNLMIDNRSCKSAKDAVIGIEIVTPRNDNPYGTEDNVLASRSSVTNEVILRLPTNSMDYFEEMRNSLQIKDYLRTVPDPNLGNSTMLRDAKNRESDQSREAALASLKEAIGNADVFANGQKIDDISSKDATVKITTGLSKVVNNVFYKLAYIVSTKDDSEIKPMINEAIRSEGKTWLEIKDEPNPLALREMKEYMDFNTNAHTSVSMRTLLDHFSAKPYGYNSSDIHWLAAKLFCRGEINISVEKEPVSIFNRSSDDLAAYFINRKYEDKLQLHTKGVVDPVAVKAARDISKELFGITETTTDTDKLMDNWQKNAEALLQECNGIKSKYSQTPEYPGETVINDAITLLSRVHAIKDPDEFYTYLKNQKMFYMDLGEDLAPIRTFFNSPTLKDMFINKGVKIVKLYENSSVYITDSSVRETVERIKNIVRSKNPNDQIKDLTELSNTFNTYYNSLLKEQLGKTLPIIEQDQNTALKDLEDKWYKDKFEEQVKNDFEGLIEKAKKEQNISTLSGYQNQSAVLLTNYLDQFSKMPVTDPSKAEGGNKQENGGDTPRPAKKRKKNLVARNITSTEWIITSEEQLNNYIEQLKNRLKQELKDNDEVDLKF